MCSTKYDAKVVKRVLQTYTGDRKVLFNSFLRSFEVQFGCTCILQKSLILTIFFHDVYFLFLWHSGGGQVGIYIDILTNTTSRIIHVLKSRSNVLLMKLENLITLIIKNSTVDKVHNSTQQGLKTSILVYKPSVQISSKCRVSTQIGGGGGGWGHKYKKANQTVINGQIKNQICTIIQTRSGGICIS